MRTEKKVTIIPERTISEQAFEHNIFVAEDGTEFLEEWECIRYEGHKAFMALLGRLILPSIKIGDVTYEMVVYLTKKEDYMSVVYEYKFGRGVTPNYPFEKNYDGSGVYFVGIEREGADDEFPLNGLVFTKAKDVTGPLQAVIDLVDGLEERIREAGI